MTWTKLSLATAFGAACAALVVLGLLLLTDLSLPDRVPSAMTLAVMLAIGVALIGAGAVIYGRSLRHRPILALAGLALLAPALVFALAAFAVAQPHARVSTSVLWAAPMAALGGGPGMHADLRGERHQSSGGARADLIRATKRLAKAPPRRTTSGSWLPPTP